MDADRFTTLSLPKPKLKSRTKDDDDNLISSIPTNSTEPIVASASIQLSKLSNDCKDNIENSTSSILIPKGF